MLVKYKKLLTETWKPIQKCFFSSNKKKGGDWESVKKYFNNSNFFQQFKSIVNEKIRVASVIANSLSSAFKLGWENDVPIYKSKEIKECSDEYYQILAEAGYKLLKNLVGESFDEFKRKFDVMSEEFYMPVSRDNNSITLIERLLKDKDVSLSKKVRNYLLQEIVEGFKKNQNATLIERLLKDKDVFSD